MEKWVYQIELTTKNEELLNLKDEWLNLINNQLGASLESHPDVFIEEHAPGNKNNHKTVIIIKKDNIIHCIVPCIITKSTFQLRLGLFKFLKFRQSQIMLVGSNFLFHQHSRQASCIEAVFNYIKDERLADLFAVEVVSGESELGLFLKESENHTISHAAENNIARKLILPADHDTYLSSMKRKVRYNIKRTVKQFVEVFNNEITLKEYTQTEDVETLLNHVDVLFSKSWQGNTLGYHKRNSLKAIEHKKNIAKNGWLRCFILECNNKPIAFVIGSQFNGTFEYEETGYDPEYSSHSPGSVMTYMLIEQLFKQNIPTNINFGYGENVYKKVFGNHSYPAFNIVACHKSSKFNYLLKAQEQLNNLYSLISRLLKKYKIDSYIRKRLKKK